MLRRLVLTVMAVALLLTLLPNQSFSWYTDSAQVGPNTITGSENFSHPVLILTVTGNGTVTVDGIDYSSDAVIPLAWDEEAVLDTIPDWDWSFTGWTGDLSGTASPQSLLMDGDKSVTATFEP